MWREQKEYYRKWIAINIVMNGQQQLIVFKMYIIHTMQTAIATGITLNSTLSCQLENSTNQLFEKPGDQTVTTLCREPSSVPLQEAAFVVAIDVALSKEMEIWIFYSRSQFSIKCLSYRHNLFATWQTITKK